MKRALDVVLSLFGLVLLSPVLLFFMGAVYFGINTLAHA